MGMFSSYGGYQPRASLNNRIQTGGGFSVPGADPTSFIDPKKFYFSNGQRVYGHDIYAARGIGPNHPHYGKLAPGALNNQRDAEYVMDTMNKAQAAGQAEVAAQDQFYRENPHLINPFDSEKQQRDLLRGQYARNHSEMMYGAGGYADPEIRRGHEQAMGLPDLNPYQGNFGPQPNSSLSPGQQYDMRQEQGAMDEMNRRAEMYDQTSYPRGEGPMNSASMQPGSMRNFNNYVTASGGYRDAIDDGTAIKQDNPGGWYGSANGMYSKNQNDVSMSLTNKSASDHIQDVMNGTAKPIETQDWLNEYYSMNPEARGRHDAYVGRMNAAQANRQALVTARARDDAAARFYRMNGYFPPEYMNTPTQQYLPPSNASQSLMFPGPATKPI